MFMCHLPFVCMSSIIKRVCVCKTSVIRHYMAGRAGQDPVSSPVTGESDLMYDSMFFTYSYMMVMMVWCHMIYQRLCRDWKTQLESYRPNQNSLLSRFFIYSACTFVVPLLPS